LLVILKPTFLLVRLVRQPFFVGKIVLVPTTLRPWGPPIHGAPRHGGVEPLSLALPDSFGCLESTTSFIAATAISWGVFSDNKSIYIYIYTVYIYTYVQLYIYTYVYTGSPQKRKHAKLLKQYSLKNNSE
jgi:hypothetical protein